MAAADYIYLAVKIADPSRATRVCRRVNKMDGKINGGAMIPRFLFRKEVKVTFLSTISYYLLNSENPIIGVKVYEVGSRAEWFGNGDYKFPKLTRAIAKGE